MGKKIKQQLSESYTATCEQMDLALRAWLKNAATLGSEQPLFALPPKEIGLIASIEGPLLHRIARNAAALELLLLFQEIGLAVGGPDAYPTVFMLKLVLERCGVKSLSVSLRELGVNVPSS